MGGFFLRQKSFYQDSSKLLISFEKRGLKKYKQYDFGLYDLFIFEKLNVNCYNEFRLEENFAIAVGTFLYKEFNPLDSVRNYYNDFKNKCVDSSEIRGCFAILIKLDDSFYLVKDAAENYLIFYNEQKSIISSSFLSIIEYSEKKVVKESLLEIFNLGFCIGSDTLYSDVHRLHSTKFVSFNNLSILKHDYYEDYSFISRFESIEAQKSHLSKYFKIISKHFDGNIIFGLTGGLDSRLILTLVHQHFKDFQVFSYGRDYESLELRCARILAKRVVRELIEIPIKPRSSLTEHDIQNNIRAGCLYNDGIVNADNFWDQEHHTLQYRTKILGENLLNIHGVGGEHYRNHLKLLKSNMSFVQFLKYQIVESRIGNIWKNPKAKQEFYEGTREKINNILNYPTSKSTFSDEELFKMYENVFNPFFRSTRVSTDNLCSYSVGPFCEKNSELLALKSFSYLGRSLTFEAELLAQINYELASVESDYGFSFTEKEPFFYKNIDVVKKILGLRNYFSLLIKLKQAKKHISQKNIELQPERINSDYEWLEGIDSILDINKVTQGEFSPLIKSAEFIIRGYTFVQD